MKLQTLIEDRKNFAVTHNDLVEKYSLELLTEREENLFIVLLSKLQRQEAFQKISLKEIKEMIDKTMTYKQLAEELYELGSKRLSLIAEREILDKKGNLISKKNDIWLPVIFSTIIVHESEREVSVRFNPDVEYLFWELKGDFSKLNVKHFVKLRSKKWKVLYRLCKRWENYPGNVEITLDNLRKLLSYEEETEYKNLKRRLMTAINKINGTTDINVKIKEKKKGRKIGSLVFSIEGLEEKLKKSISDRRKTDIELKESDLYKQNTE